MKIRFKLLTTAILFLIIGGAGYVFAQPSTAPSAGIGVSLPLTVGAEPQTKSGRLTLNQLCLGGQCRTDWPSSSVRAQTQTVNGSTTVFTGGQSGSYSSSPSRYSCFRLRNQSITSEYCYPDSYSNYLYNASFTLTTDAAAGIVVSEEINLHDIRCNQNSSSWTLPSDVRVSYNNSNQLVITGTCNVYYPRSYIPNFSNNVSANINVRYIY